MTVSVIITVYNLEGFVSAAIESALSQTIKPTEIIVVDDGSTDGSAKIIQSFGNKVRLLQMPTNSGVLPAFMEGMKAAKGEVLAFLDGDDVWMPEKLEKVLQVFATNEDVMLVTHMHCIVDKNGFPTGEKDATHKNCERITAVTNNSIKLDSLIKNSILCYKGIWLGSAFCIRRSAIELKDYERWAYNLPGKELSHQDQPLAAYLIYTNPDKRIYLINEELFLYRMYGTNSSGSSVNAASALKTLARSRATNFFTKNIVERKPEWGEANRKQGMMILETDFLRDLYSNRRWAALKKYFNLFGFWNSEKKIKETKRMLGCFVLGPDRFLELKTRKRFS